MQALKRSARELIEGSRDDSSWVKVQMQELSTRWETVCALSISKQTRLEAALRQVNVMQIASGHSEKGFEASTRTALGRNCSVPPFLKWDNHEKEILRASLPWSS